MRAAVLFAMAALTALVGAAIAGNQRTSATDLYGDLRPVVITRGAVPAKAITPESARRRLEVVQVPTRFAPAGAISDPKQAVGLKPLGDLPPGLYLTAALLRPPRPAGKRSMAASRLGRGRQPVEIAVTGASAIAFAPGSRRVDVVVTSEVGPGGQGRTYLAARAVPLIDLAPAQAGPESGSAIAILGLDRRQALDLIRAESYARGIRLLPHVPATRNPATP